MKTNIVMTHDIVVHATICLSMHKYPVSLNCKVDMVNVFDRYSKIKTVKLKHSGKILKKSNFYSIHF